VVIIGVEMTNDSKQLSRALVAFGLDVASAVFLEQIKKIEVSRDLESIYLFVVCQLFKKDSHILIKCLHFEQLFSTSFTYIYEYFDLNSFSCQFFVVNNKIRRGSGFLETFLI
jgi:hypothetical protein